MNNHLKPSWLSWPNWKERHVLAHTDLSCRSQYRSVFLECIFFFDLIQFTWRDSNFTSLYNKRYVYADLRGFHIVKMPINMALLTIVPAFLADLALLWHNRAGWGLGCSTHLRASKTKLLYDTLSALVFSYPCLSLP